MCVQVPLQVKVWNWDGWSVKWLLANLPQSWSTWLLIFLARTIFGVFSSSLHIFLVLPHNSRGPNFVGLRDVFQHVPSAVSCSIQVMRLQQKQSSEGFKLSTFSRGGRFFKLPNLNLLPTCWDRNNRFKKCWRLLFQITSPISFLTLKKSWQILPLAIQLRSTIIGTSGGGGATQKNFFCSVFPPIPFYDG